MKFLPITTMPLAASMVFCTLTSPTFAEEDLPQVDQFMLNGMVESGDMVGAFDHVFEAGDELTEHSFDADSGVGINVGEGRRFTRFPRADLTGPTEWANHFPTREGGANATSCVACHNAPAANGAGDVALNVVVDPGHTADPSKYLERNTLPLFALGVPQRLAEEMSIDLYLQRDDAIQLACASGKASAALGAKGVSFGVLEVTRTKQEPCAYELDTSGVAGVDPDLMIKPFGWKGNHATIRAFTRGAAHNELGLQGVELVGELDGDYDGVTNELTVGDMTALTIYMAALERPVRYSELASLGLMDMSAAENTVTALGELAFGEVGCASCHVPEMTLTDPVFSEPSKTPGFHDIAFPDGSDPATAGLAYSTRIAVDLTRDQPNNRIEHANGTMTYLGALPVNNEGLAVANWYTDFKRHDMGETLSDPDDPLGIGARMFLTRSLAGVGATGPWLHDGRATTLDEAILAHGGDALKSREAYVGLPEPRRNALVAFLESLTIFKIDTGEE